VFRLEFCNGRSSNVFDSSAHFIPKKRTASARLGAPLWLQGRLLADLSPGNPGPLQDPEVPASPGCLDTVSRSAEAGSAAIPFFFPFVSFSSSSVRPRAFAARINWRRLTAFPTGYGLPGHRNGRRHGRRQRHGSPGLRVAPASFPPFHPAAKTLLDFEDALE